MAQRRGVRRARSGRVSAAHAAGNGVGLWSRRGTLRLSLPFGGALCDFSVRAMQRGLLFLADAPHEPSAAAGAALKASAILRRPLQNVMTAARELFDRVEDLEEPAATAVSSELNRGLYQLLRLCGQLTTGGVLLAGIIMGLASAGLLGALSGLFAV